MPKLEAALVRSWQSDGQCPGGRTTVMRMVRSPMNTIVIGNGVADSDSPRRT